MSSAVDIQMSSIQNLTKIENYFKDVSYRESIEYSANYNTRLCLERRLRLPFLDPQTGVAQNHSQLFIDKRQRMPGFRQGQVYTYPAARWRKSRRQYLNKVYKFPTRPFQALHKEHEALIVNAVVPNSLTAGTASPALLLHDPDSNSALLEESSSLGAAGGDTSDSKDSQLQPQQQFQQQLKEELPKEWFYDDIDINDVDSLEEPKSPADDEYDYDPRYGSKKRRKRKPGKRASLTPGEPSSGRRRTGASRGRTPANAATAAGPVSVAAAVSIESPFGGLGSFDPNVNEPTTPTTATGGRRPRGSGTRGRRRTKVPKTNSCDPFSPGLINEPPSFESAAAAVGVTGDLAGVDDHGDLRNYRKYL